MMTPLELCLRCQVDFWSWALTIRPTATVTDLNEWRSKCYRVIDGKRTYVGFAPRGRVAK